MQNYASLEEARDPEEQGILYHVAEPTRSKWNHIEDLDSFFSRMYKYHKRHGFLCIVLQDIFNLNQFVFVVLITTYLVHGINYPVLFNIDNQRQQKPTLSDIILPISECVENFTTTTWFFIIIAAGVLCVKFLTMSYSCIYYWETKKFYNIALKIEDSNLDNLTWHEVQEKIIAVQLEQQMCIHKRELTPLDIYHRILRRENYIIALINKGLLPPTISLPFIGEYVYWTNSLQYSIEILLFRTPWSPFKSPWHLREEYKRQKLRHESADKFARQTWWLALISFIFATIIFAWLILNMFFNYAEIIKREPGKIGVRTWSLYGKHYFRHFNELDHELHARLTRAYRPATKYLAAFSSPIATVIAQHIGFLSGGIFAIILALTIYDEDVIAVEHVITLMTCLGAIIAICRAVIPDETTIWYPERLLENVVVHTHYLPANWRGCAHTSKIRTKFQQLFQYRFVALLEELLSPILTPYFLLVWVYPRALEIVDFFRNFTVSVPGVGDVCSFAELDVKKHGNPNWQRVSSIVESSPDQYTQAEDGKLELSLVHFTTTNPSWVPPPSAQQFVEELQDELAPHVQNSDGMFFTNLHNLLESSSMADFNNMTSLMNLRKNGRGIPTPAKSTFVQGNAASHLDVKTSASLAEGPDMMGPLTMTSSALALHDRNFMQTTQKNTRSLEETTPLLPSKSTF